MWSLFRKFDVDTSGSELSDSDSLFLSDNSVNVVIVVTGSVSVLLLSGGGGSAFSSLIAECLDSWIGVGMNAELAAPRKMLGRGISRSVSGVM